MSDTPRTDAHTRQLIDILQHPHWIEFARQLERENAALRADKERMDWLEKSQMLWEGKDWLRGPEFITRAAIDAARESVGDDAIMRQHLNEGGTPT